MYTCSGLVSPQVMYVQIFLPFHNRIVMESQATVDCVQKHTHTGMHMP